MNVTPIGGKTPNSTLQGIAVNENGRIITKKEWENKLILAYEMTALPTTTATIAVDAIDVSDSAAFSLRIDNTTDVGYTIGFYSDVSSNKYGIRDIQSNVYDIDIAANTRFVAVTPDDLPIMQWMYNVRLYIMPKSVPTTGSLKIWLVKKC